MSIDKECFSIFLLENIVFSGAESVKFLDSKILGLKPNEIKCLQNLRDFKTAIKKPKPTLRRCKICKTYFHVVYTYINKRQYVKMKKKMSLLFISLN